MRILSGTEAGRTLGTPIGLLVANEDARPGDYGDWARRAPRPSHADYTYVEKVPLLLLPLLLLPSSPWLMLPRSPLHAQYGTHASSGGGRSSARETIGRVAAGAVAEKWLRLRFGVEIVAWVSQIGPVELPAGVVNEASLRSPAHGLHAPRQRTPSSARPAERCYAQRRRRAPDALPRARVCAAHGAGGAQAGRRGVARPPVARVPDETAPPSVRSGRARRATRSAAW